MILGLDAFCALLAREFELSNVTSSTDLSTELDVLERARLELLLADLGGAVEVEELTVGAVHRRYAVAAAAGALNDPLDRLS